MKVMGMIIVAMPGRMMITGTEGGIGMEGHIGVEGLLIMAAALDLLMVLMMGDAAASDLSVAMIPSLALGAVAVTGSRVTMPLFLFMVILRCSPVQTNEASMRMTNRATSAAATAAEKRLRPGAVNAAMRQRDLWWL